MDPARARALQVALGRAVEADRGTPLPPFFHHIYFWDPQPPARLGRDGQAVLGGLIPDMGLPNRTWAAGRLLFHTKLLAGVQAEKISHVESVSRKDGKSGALAFVKLRHDIRQRGTVVLTEWQDIVYRDDTATQPDPPMARTDETLSHDARFDSTLLFRYCALTMNGHRIHYDAPYAREREGYDDLVVQGPLLAQLVMLMGEAQLGKPLTEVSYRATAPLTLPHGATLCWADGNAWVRGPNGEQCLTAVMR